MNAGRDAPYGSAIEPLEGRALFAAGALDVSIGPGGAHSASYLDADGTSVVVSLQGGSATLRFTGDSLATAAAPGKTTAVSGGAASLRTLSLTGTSAGTSLVITASGGGAITAPFIGKALVTGTFTGGINTSSADSLDLRLVRDSLIVVTGDVRSASFVALQDSSVYVGLRRLPVVPSNYAAKSFIGSLRVGAYDPFSPTHSLVAASFIGRIFIGNLLNDFAYELRDYILADRINHLTVKVHTTHLFYTVRRNQLDGTSVSFAMLLIQAM